MNDSGERREDLLLELLRAILVRAPTYAQHPLDASRFRTTEPGLRDRISRGIRGRLWERWFGPHFKARTSQSTRALDDHTEALRNLGPLYHALADDASRRILVEVLAHRLLGHERSPLPANQAAYWEDRERVLACVDPSSPELRRGSRLHDLTPLGVDLRLHARTHSIHAVFVGKQYRYEAADIGARPGDVVLDCGACWGDTTLQFATCVGETGQVHAFEFVPENLELLRLNLELNPETARRVHVHEQPVWSSSDRELAFDGVADNSRLSPNGGGGPTVRTVAIDDYVQAVDLERVHLIKMDVEGAELEALRGAERTLRRDRPQLAISIYHHPDDLWRIPRFLQALDLGYELYVDHRTTYFEETMLFARAGRG